jgi:hypothetical protein
VGVDFRRFLLSSVCKGVPFLHSGPASPAEMGRFYRPLPEGAMCLASSRLVLASGRSAMIGDGMGIQFVPWRPALERHLGREISVIWSFERKIGLGI